MRQWKKMLLTVVAVVLFLAACGAEDTAYAGKLNERLDEENKPVGMTVAQGVYLNVVEWETSKRLNRENGQYLVYYVENWGDTAVAIFINDVSSDPIKPGENGYLVVEVTNVMGLFSREYNCEIRTLEGGLVSVKGIAIQGELEELQKWEKEA